MTKAVVEKSKNIILLLRCFFFFLLHGKANKQIESPKSVVIIQRAKFGDMIAITPMIHAVKNKFPNCRVTVVGTAINKQVIADNPSVDKYIVWKDEYKKMINTFKKEKFDFACVTITNFHSFATLYLAGIKSIATPFITNGWSPYETKSYKLVKSLGILKEHRMKEHVPAQYLKLLEPLGISNASVKKHIHWSKEADQKMTSFLAPYRKKHPLIVGLIPGAGNKVKQWPEERFAVVSDYLIENHNALICILGSTANRTEMDAVLKSIKNKDSALDCSFTTIDELKALIPKFDMTISVDTGPIFIAEAADVPTIDIAGSIDVNEMAPNDGNIHLVVTGDSEPQIWTMNARILDHKKLREGIESITPDMVIEKVNVILEKIKAV